MTDDSPRATYGHSWFELVEPGASRIKRWEVMGSTIWIVFDDGTRRLASHTTLEDLRLGVRDGRMKEVPVVPDKPSGHYRDLAIRL